MFDVCALRPMQHSERIYCVDLWQAMLARFAISRTVAHKPMPHSMWPIHLCMHCQYSVEWVFIVSRFLDHISLCGCVCVCAYEHNPQSTVFHGCINHCNIFLSTELISMQLAYAVLLPDTIASYVPH